MAFLGILSAVTPVIDKVLDLIPDPNARAKAKAELTSRLMEIEHEQRMAQVELNKTEAQHKSVFVAGWRPFIGWVGGLALAYSFVLQPFMEFIALSLGYQGRFPVLDVSQLLTLVLAMLGIGGMRSFDKIKGVSTESLKSIERQPYNN